MTIETADDKMKKHYLATRVRKARRMLKMLYDRHDVETSVADCLTDLMHLCNAEEWGYWDAHRRAAGHFLAEQKGGQHG